MRASVGSLGTLGVAAVTVVVALGVGAADARGSALTLAHVEGERPTLRIAQRVIERSWGPSEDSVYVEVEVPGWRSEGIAIGLSLVAPGLGHAYVGEHSAWWFALAELSGWAAREVYRRRGRALRDEAVGFAGNPADPASAWSFARWAAASQDDPSELEALYAADPEVFYDLIAADPRLLTGWGADAAGTRAQFGELRQRSQARFRYARYVGVGLWLNHVTAAVAALRAARIHNLPLRRNLELRLRGRWDEAPALRAGIERRF